MLSIILALGLGGLVLQYESFRRLRQYGKRIEREQYQHACEQRLYTVLQISHPLPPMRGWAISPDIGWLYICQLFEHKPETVVECGSGVSTVLAAYTLKQIGHGKVIALEHDQTFAQATKKLLQARGLEAYAEVLYTPLISTPLPDQTNYQWYDLSRAHLPSHVDFLLIDGPPGPLQPFSRIGALPLLRSRLHAGSFILVDDANRPDEQAMVRRWMEQDDLTCTSFNAEKGAVLLSFKPSLEPETEHEERPKFT